MAMAAIVEVFLVAIHATIVDRVAMEVPVMALSFTIGIVDIAVVFKLTCRILYHNPFVMMMWYHHVNKNHQKRQQERYGYKLVFHN